MIPRVVILNVIFFLRTSVSVEFNIDLVLSTRVARELETLEAICEVTTNDTKRNYQIVWFKILPDSTDDEVEIATNDFVNKEFKDTNRYEARLELVKPDYTNVRFFLTISRLQSEDSGYLGCRIGLPLVTIERFKPFIVQVPVHSVWWSTTPPDSFFPIPIPFRADENISWTEGEAVQLTCHCIGGYPRPDVEIALGAEDMTHRFTRSDELVRGGDGGQAPGLQPIHYSVELSNRGVVAEYRFDARLLKCRARLPGIEDNKSALLNIRIAEYRPKFFCTRQMTTKLGQENFNLTCLVKAEPEIRNTTVFRYDRHPFDNRSLPLNETDAYQFYSETINEDEMLLVLRISRVSSEHLGSYVFVATNDLGSERHKVELHKELSAELRSTDVSSCAAAAATGTARNSFAAAKTLVAVFVRGLFSALPPSPLHLPFLLLLFLLSASVTVTQPLHNAWLSTTAGR